MKNKKHYSGKFKTANFITNNKHVAKYLKKAGLIESFVKHKCLQDAEISNEWYDDCTTCMAVEYTNGTFVIDVNEDAFKLLSHFGIYLNSVKVFGMESMAYESLNWE
jgi:hypothetical protein